MKKRKAAYSTPTSEIFEVRYEGCLMENSPYGDGGYPGQTITDDPDYNYEI